VAAFGEHDIEMPVAIHIADVHVRGRLGGSLQRDDSIEPQEP
jgi:hypothetical protein